MRSEKERMIEFLKDIVGGGVQFDGKRLVLAKPSRKIVREDDGVYVAKKIRPRTKHSKKCI